MPGATDRTVDELLVLACVSGSETAFVELHQRWRRKLLAHAGHLLGKPLQDRAEDVCQDAWLGIQRGLAALHEPRHFRSWAYSIVTRRVVDLQRRLQRERRVSRDLQQDCESVNQQPVAGDSVAADSERLFDLRTALDQLSSEDRALVRLFYLDELSVAETAAALGVPPGTVKSRLFHARRRLRHALGGKQS